MQVPAVCSASNSGQRQPAPGPAVGSAAGREQAGLLTPWGSACDGHKVPQPPKSCSLLQSERRLSGMHGRQWAAKKTPLLGGFFWLLLLFASLHRAEASPVLGQWH